jgi:hypothetical protein
MLYRGPSLIAQDALSSPSAAREHCGAQGTALQSMNGLAIWRAIANSCEGRTSRRLRKKIEMLFAHLKRVLKLDRLRLRGPCGACDEFILAATAQNLRKMAKPIPMPSLAPA